MKLFYAQASGHESLWESGGTEECILNSVTANDWQKMLMFSEH